MKTRKQMRRLALLLALALCLALFAGCGKKTAPLRDSSAEAESDEAESGGSGTGRPVTALKGTPVEKLAYSVKTLPTQLGTCIESAARTYGGDTAAVSRGGACDLTLRLSSDSLDEIDGTEASLRAVSDPDSGDASLVLTAADGNGEGATLGLFVADGWLYLETGGSGGQTECLRVNLDELDDIAGGSAVTPNDLVDMLSPYLGIEPDLLRTMLGAVDYERLSEDLSALLARTLEENTTERKGSFQLPDGAVETTRLTMELGGASLVEFLLELRTILSGAVEEMQTVYARETGAPTGEIPSDPPIFPAGYYSNGYGSYYSDGNYFYDFVVPTPALLAPDSLCGWQYVSFCDTDLDKGLFEPCAAPREGIPAFEGVGSGAEAFVRAQLDEFCEDLDIRFSTDLYGDVPVQYALDLTGPGGVSLQSALWLWAEGSDSVFGLDVCYQDGGEVYSLSLEETTASGDTHDLQHDLRVIVDLDGERATLTGAAGVDRSGDTTSAEYELRLQTSDSLSGRYTAHAERTVRSDGGGSLTAEGELAMEEDGDGETVGFALELHSDPGDTAVDRSSWRSGDPEYDSLMAFLSRFWGSRMGAVAEAAPDAASRGI